MSQVDWGRLMRAGIRGLRLTPSEFWALTPAELTLMLGEGAGALPMTRDRLEALGRAYPDKTGETSDG